MGLQLTWLILPVVICLFQRLSHACLSIRSRTAKLRMAHYNSYRLLGVLSLYMDTDGNSRANTCVQTRLSEGLCLLDTEPTQVFLVPVDS